LYERITNREQALDKTTKTESVVESLRKVRGLPRLEEYAVQF
jgi:hypothetical protein